MQPLQLRPRWVGMSRGEGLHPPPAPLLLPIGTFNYSRAGLMTLGQQHCFCVSCLGGMSLAQKESPARRARQREGVWLPARGSQARGHGQQLSQLHSSAMGTQPGGHGATAGLGSGLSTRSRSPPGRASPFATAGAANPPREMKGGPGKEGSSQVCALLLPPCPCRVRLMAGAATPRGSEGRTQPGSPRGSGAPGRCRGWPWHADCPRG